MTDQTNRTLLGFEGEGVPCVKCSVDIIRSWDTKRRRYVLLCPRCLRERIEPRPSRRSERP